MSRADFRKVETGGAGSRAALPERVTPPNPIEPAIGFAIRIGLGPVASDALGFENACARCFDPPQLREACASHDMDVGIVVGIDPASIVEDCEAVGRPVGPRDGKGSEVQGR